MEALFRRGVLLLCALALLGIDVGSAVAASPLAEKTLLRLDELPKGFVFDEFSYCEPVKPHPDSGKEALAGYVDRFHPYSCHLSYTRLYSSPEKGSTPRSSPPEPSPPGPQRVRRRAHRSQLN